MLNKSNRKVNNLFDEVNDIDFAYLKNFSLQQAEWETKYTNRRPDELIHLEVFMSNPTCTKNLDEKDQNWFDVINQEKFTANVATKLPSVQIQQSKKFIANHKIHLDKTGKVMFKNIPLGKP